jgi:hypothetical protein
MNSGIIITTAILALEIRTIKVDLEAMVHPMDMVNLMDIIIITTSDEKKRS